MDRIIRGHDIPKPRILPFRIERKLLVNSLGHHRIIPIIEAVVFITDEWHKAKEEAEEGEDCPECTIPEAEG